MLLAKLLIFTTVCEPYIYKMHHNRYVALVLENVTDAEYRLTYIDIYGVFLWLLCVYKVS